MCFPPFAITAYHTHGYAMVHYDPPPLPGWGMAPNASNRMFVWTMPED